MLLCWLTINSLLIDVKDCCRFMGLRKATFVLFGRGIEWPNMNVVIMVSQVDLQDD